MSEKKKKTESLSWKKDHPLVSVFFEPPFALITALSLLGYVSTNSAHLDYAIFAHSSLQNCSSSVQFDADRLWTAVWALTRPCKDIHLFLLQPVLLCALGHCNVGR